jgi:hypothetical protein
MHSKSRSRATAGDARSPDASAGAADVSTKATDTTADAPAKTAAGAETSDVTAATTTDVTAANAPASSPTKSTTTTTAGLGGNGDEGHREEQHGRDADAALQHGLWTTDTGQIRSCRWRLRREQRKGCPRIESS